MGERPIQKKMVARNITQLVKKSVTSNKLLSLSLSCLLHKLSSKSGDPKNLIKINHGNCFRFEVHLSNLITIVFILLVYVSNSLNLFFFRILSLYFSLILCFCHNLIFFVAFLIGIGLVGRFIFSEVRLTSLCFSLKYLL